MQLELYYPVTPMYITQKFGETANLAYYKANGVNFTGHNGVDIIAKHGEPIYASHDGTAYYEIDGSQGHGVVLRTDKTFDYNGEQVYFKTIYWHMVDSTKEPNFKSPVEGHPNGLKVKAGDIIGYANSTGLSTGDHLHYGLKPCLPNEGANTWYNYLQTNGYQGAIDPVPYFNGKYAKDISSPKHVFLTDLKLGDRGEEVKQLQVRLKELGHFPSYQECTGYYGPVTREAVYAFQQDYVSLSLTDMWYHGKYCGPKTRTALNNIK